MRCIYSGEIIHSKNISIDHFLPFSFVAHDQIWNLLPTIKSVNSSKGNKLPDLNVYLNDFLTMQFDAFRVNIEKKQHKILEDFGLIFKSDLQEIYEGNFESFAQKMRENILPLVQIAVNMGFQNTWKYGKP